MNPLLSELLTECVVFQRSCSMTESHWIFGSPPPPQDKPQPAAAKPRPCKWSELPDLAIRAGVNLVRRVMAVGKEMVAPPPINHATYPTNPAVVSFDIVTID